jgi:hypothetical protein
MPDNIPERISVKAPIKTKADELLEESFYKDLAGQAERLDKFALELIKLQLAIPALYAGILKLLDVREVAVATATVKTISVVPDVTILLSIFTPWIFALGLSFLAVFPMQHYEVKTNPIIEPLPDKPTGAIAINAYLHFSAKRKLRLLAVSSFLTFIGIAFAVFGSL